MPAAAVRANQKRDSPVSTRPLSGMGVGSTTSNAESRSDATSSSRSASRAYRSRTLPERRNAALAADVGERPSDRLRLPGRHERVQAREDGRRVAQVEAVVEAGGQPVRPAAPR